MPEPRLFSDPELVAVLRELSQRRTTAVSAGERLRLSEAANVIEAHAKLAAAAGSVKEALDQLPPRPAAKR
jgi:hypothetical protein